MKKIFICLLFFCFIGTGNLFAEQAQLSSGETWGATRTKINANATDAESRIGTLEINSADKTQSYLTFGSNYPITWTFDTGATSDLVISFTGSGELSANNPIGRAQSASAGYLRLYESSLWGGNYIDVSVADSLSENHTVSISDDGITFDGLKTKVIVESGQITLPSATITAGSCASVVQILAPDVETTDFIDYSFVSDPTSLTGYGAPPFVRILKYGTTGKINFKVCNDTASSITTSAAVINWEITR